MQFFKRYLPTLIFAVTLFGCQTYSYASNLHIILGADYLSSDIKYNNIKKKTSLNKNEDDDSDFVKIKDDFKSISPVIGIGAYGISLEAYILNSEEIEEDSIKAKIRAYGVDVIGEASLSDNFSVVASLGLVQYTFKREENNIEREEESSGPRVGIGLQYYLTRNIAIRGMYHYTHLNSGEADHYKAVSEFLAGIRLIF